MTTINTLIWIYTIIWGIIIFLKLQRELNNNYENMLTKQYWIEKLHCTTCRTFWLSTLLTLDLRVSIAITSVNLIFDWEAVFATDLSTASDGTVLDREYVFGVATSGDDPGWGR